MGAVALVDCKHFSAFRFEFLKAEHRVKCCLTRDHLIYSTFLDTVSSSSQSLRLCWPLHDMVTQWHASFSATGVGKLPPAAHKLNVAAQWMPRCCYCYWSALTCSSALVKMHLMSPTFAVVIIKALLVMCWDSGGSWNLCLYGGGEFLWMASNSRGQMNCWIFPRSRFSACSLCLSLARSLSAPAPSQCAASHCMWHSASVWKSADG